MPPTLATLALDGAEASTAHEHPSDTPEGLDGRTVGELTETETGEP